jgi:hypothetical protein
MAQSWALGSPSVQLKQHAVLAVRHILASGRGRSAAISSNTVRALIPLIDDARLSKKGLLDTVISLEAIASHSRPARKFMKEAGLFEKLHKYTAIGTEENLREIAIKLRDSLR